MLPRPTSSFLQGLHSFALGANLSKSLRQPLRSRSMLMAEKTDGPFNGLFKSWFGGLKDKITDSVWTSPGGGDPKDWGKKAKGDIQIATLGAGCYWGTEKFFAKDFDSIHPDVILGTSVGFMNPDPDAKPDPSYRNVCSGRTGYVEVLHMMFDSSKVSYEDVCKHFFTFHDPTTPDRQGNDVGT